MAKLEDEILGAFKGTTTKPEEKKKPAAAAADGEDQKPDAEGEEELDADGGEMEAGEVGDDGKKRIHSFGDQFKKKYGPRKPKEE